MTLGGLIVSFLLGIPLLRAGRSGIVPSVHAQEEENLENRACSVATLKGTYGFYRTGWTSVGPLAAVGFATFDGAGTTTARQTIRKNGVTTEDLFKDPAIAGPYEVDPDCTGRLLDGAGNVFSHFVVVDGGREIIAMSLSPGNSVYGMWKKINSLPRS
jgi:hypothetical protein